MQLSGLDVHRVQERWGCGIQTVDLSRLSPGDSWFFQPQGVEAALAQTGSAGLEWMLISCRYNTAWNRNRKADSCTSNDCAVCPHARSFSHILSSYSIIIFYHHILSWIIRFYKSTWIMSFPLSTVEVRHAPACKLVIKALLMGRMSSGGCA